MSVIAPIYFGWISVINDDNCPIPIIISSYCRTIKAIGKSIIAYKTLSSCYKPIRIQEPLDNGIVVAGLEVIPSCLSGLEVSFPWYLDRKPTEKVAIISVLRATGFLAGTTTQGFFNGWPFQIINPKAHYAGPKTDA